MSVLEIVAFALSGFSILMLSVLVTRRWELARRERHRHDVEDRLKQVALELIHSGADPPSDLRVDEKEALADLLGRYARATRGTTHERIVEYFAREGTIERELSALADGKPGWRRATAAFRLGDIGTVAVAGSLVVALHDPDRAVRIAAVRSLGRLRAPEAGTDLVSAAADRRVPGALVRWALLQIGAPALPQLRERLSVDDVRARAAAVQLIGLLGGPSDAPAVEARLTDSSALVRAQAARALGRLGGERSFAELMNALEDRIPAVREAAAVALGQLRDPRSVEALAEHAIDDGFEVARACAQAVARIDRAAATDKGRITGSVHLREAADLAGIR